VNKTTLVCAISLYFLINYTSITLDIVCAACLLIYYTPQTEFLWGK